MNKKTSDVSTIFSLLQEGVIDLYYGVIIL